MVKRFKRCILHIGTEKTGSSSIQAFLNQNRKTLLKDGILYPHTSIGGSQWEFVALTHPCPWTMDVGEALKIEDAESRETFKMLFLENLKRQAAQSPEGQTLLISSEHFHSRLEEDAIEALKSILDTFAESYEIVVYFRRQDQLAVSHFTTQIKSGYSGSGMNLQHHSVNDRYYNFDQLVTRWSNVFGSESIKAGLYKKLSKTENGMLNDFCNKCSIDISNKTLPKWYNRSLSAAGLKFIQSVNQIYKNHEGILSADDRQSLINRLSEQNEGRFYPISKSEAETFYAKFIDSNESLRARLFPKESAPLFEEDFSYYPEDAETLPDSYNDAVIQAVKLWQRPQKESWVRKHGRSVKNTLSKKLP